MCDITWYPDGNHWSTYVKVCRVSAYMGGTSGYLGGSKKCIDCKHLGRLPHLICIFISAAMPITIPATWIIVIGSEYCSGHGTMSTALASRSGLLTLCLPSGQRSFDLPSSNIWFWSTRLRMPQTMDISRTSTTRSISFCNSQWHWSRFLREFSPKVLLNWTPYKHFVVPELFLLARD